MYVIRLTRVTIAAKIPVNTLTLCYSIWAADHNKYRNTIRYPNADASSHSNTMLGDRLQLW